MPHPDFTLPSRSRTASYTTDQHGAPDLPPADAAKPDDQAIDDVYTQVEATGSLAAAAVKLAEIAQHEQEHGGAAPRVVARRQAYAWEDDPEEAEFLAQQAEEEGEVAEDDEYGYGYGEEEEIVIDHLQEVVEGLWIGDLVSAMDAEGLRARGIANVVSLLRPRLEFAPEFAAYALEIDDAQTTDILTHLPGTTAWITEALAKRAAEGEGEVGAEDTPRHEDIPADAPPTHAGGVLVHCQAGMSRSATVVAAYLMRAQGLDPVDAVSYLRECRPVVDPSETFWYQLGLYGQAQGRVTLKDRSTRQFYLERTTGLVMNQGARPSTEHMARYPTTPTASAPPTPAGGQARRKIRCKMCRRHLAIREHMMDHILDQLPPAAAPAPASRPRTPSNFTLPAPLSAMTDNDAADEVIEDEDGGPSSAAAAATGSAARSRRPSVVSDVINPLTGLPGARSRRPSVPGNATPPQGRSRARSVLGEDLTMSRQASTPGIAAGAPAPSASAPAPVTGPGGRPILDADALAARLPPQLAALRAGLNPANNVVSASPAASSPADSPPTSPDQGPRRRMSSSLGGLGMTPATPAVSAPASAYPPNHPLAGLAAMGMPGMPGLTGLTSAGGPPILVNPKCSGYFVEPLTWMEPVLAGGAVSGKLVCPNEKCGAKIGNFDWAGVQCGCKDWVTPGFCLARSKVEEVW